MSTIKSIRRMADGGLKSLKERDHGYFTEPRGRAGRSYFREDVRNIVGGALAAAFIATAITSFVHIPVISEGAFAAIAAVIGGFAGKTVLA